MKKNNKITVISASSKPFLELIRGIKLGITNLFRNKLLTIATIVVMAVMLSIYNGIFIVNKITKNALNSLNQKIDIILYLKQEMEFSDAKALTESLSRFPGVHEVKYISKTQALDILSQNYPESVEFLNRFDLENPLPPGISIKTEKAEDHQKIIKYIQNSRFSQFMDFSQNDQRSDKQILSATANNLIEINRFVEQLIFWIVFTFLTGGALIIVNAVQMTIFARQNEIQIMKMVGAKPFSIRLPYITECVIVALIAVILSFLLIGMAGHWLQIEQNIFENIFIKINWRELILTELSITIALSVISGILAMERYMGKKLNIKI